MRGRSSIIAGRRRSAVAVAAVAVAASVSACSQGPRQDINEPNGTFPVQITEASFPASQTLSQHANMVIRVRNAGSKPIPDVAVTVCNVTCDYPAPPGEGSSSTAFASNSGESYLAHPELPVWIVDHPPGPCSATRQNINAGYSCQAGGGGADTTSSDNTWAAGQLFPGDTETFRWSVTAMSAGQHVVAYSVAAGLNGKAKAVLSGGGEPKGTFTVNISQAPAQSHVNDAGQIVSTPSAAGQP